VKRVGKRSGKASSLSASPSMPESSSRHIDVNSNRNFLNPCSGRLRYRRLAPSADSPDGRSLIIAAGTRRAFCKIRDCHFQIPFQMSRSCSARSSNLHKANIHHSIHTTKTYRSTRTGFCAVLILPDHFFMNDTSLKSDGTDSSFALSSELVILSYLNHDKSLYPIYQWTWHILTGWCLFCRAPLTRVSQSGI
jgi:hypothetical protein